MEEAGSGRSHTDYCTYIPVYIPATSHIPVVEIGEEEVSKTMIARYDIASRLTIATV